MPIFCRACSKAGHLTDDCLDEQLPACVPLPPPSAKHREILSELLVEIKGENQMIAILIQGGLSIGKWSKSFPLHNFTKKREPPEVSLPLRNSHDGAI